MSSTATLKRTDPAVDRFVLVLTGRTARILLCTLIFSVLIISLRPFGFGLAEGPSTGGDPLNQIGFTMIGGLAILSLLFLADRREVAGLLDVPLLIMFAMVFVSFVSGLGMNAGGRVFLFTAFAIAGIAAILVIPRDAQSLATVFVATAALVLALSYAGLVLFPERAIHQGYEQEAIHAGLWRGVFSHKNIAGPVMAGLTFAGIMAMRLGRPFAGFAITAAAGYFVLHTGSKTSAGLVPLAAFIVIAPGLFGQRWLTAAIALFTLAVFLTFTVGMVLSETIFDIVQAVAPGTTYTGRTSLWTFMIDRIQEAPWTGVGLEDFWKTPAVLAYERPWYLAWDVRGSVHGHNGYLDIVLALGIPAAVYFAIVMILRPAINYVQAPRLKPNVVLSDFFMMVFVFTTLNACLESFFFRRADPVWLLFFMAVFGLKLGARFPIVMDSRADASPRRP